jgi:hypothetical protein
MGKRRKETVYLSQLEEIQILWPGDVRTLAEFILHCYDAKDRAVDSRQSASRMESRPTVHGLAGYFAWITGIPEVRIERSSKSTAFLWTPRSNSTHRLRPAHKVTGREKAMIENNRTNVETAAAWVHLP